MRTSSKIIIALLVLNIVVTFVFGVINAIGPSTQKPYEKASRHQLPDFITYSVKSNILSTFIEHFNNADYDALYNMHGSVAKSIVSQETMSSEFTRLSDFYHGIDDGIFSFAEYSGQRGSTKVYELNYTVKFSEQSEFGEVGKLKVTIGVEDQQYQIYGIYLHANTIT